MRNSRIRRALASSEWSLVLLAGLLLGACSVSSVDPQSAAPAGEMGQIVQIQGGGQYYAILPQELFAMLQTKDFFFANVHVPYEGEIAGTDAFLPYDQLLSLRQQLPSAKDARIVLYCRSGNMSAIAARALVQAGYTNVYNLDGGFRAWAEAGYELIQQP